MLQRGDAGKEGGMEASDRKMSSASSSSSSRLRPAGLGGGNGLGGSGSGAGAGAPSSATTTTTTTKTAGTGTGGEEQTISYSAERIIGHGSFGVVFQATELETREVVAIKKVLQDKRFKNRELQIMKQLVKLPHPNIVLLKQCFYSNGEKPEELYLNLVLEYIPETVYSVARQYQKSKQAVPLLQVKLYVYQLARALAHIHGLGICHRDIKPQNLLLDPETHVLKLCDFGSAKFLVKGEPNVSYICSRYYRAPELIFGSTNYTPSIDVWSEGCVAAELLLGHPLFPGDSGVDQLVEIIKVLGTPTREEIRAMNPNYTEFKFPQIKAHPWNKVFRSRLPQEAIDVVARMLAYAPERRIRPVESCAHAFFDELRDPNTRLPNGKPLPPQLFNFTDTELRLAPPGLVAALVPPHARAAAVGGGIDAKEEAAGATAGSSATSSLGASSSSSSSTLGVGEMPGGHPLPPPHHQQQLQHQHQAVRAGGGGEGAGGGGQS